MKGETIYNQCPILTISSSVFLCTDEVPWGVIEGLSGYVLSSIVEEEISLLLCDFCPKYLSYEKQINKIYFCFL